MWTRGGCEATWEYRMRHGPKRREKTAGNDVESAAKGPITTGGGDSAILSRHVVHQNRPHRFPILPGAPTDSGTSGVKVISSPPNSTPTLSDDYLSFSGASTANLYPQIVIR